MYDFCGDLVFVWWIRWIVFVVVLKYFWVVFEILIFFGSYFVVGFCVFWVYFCCVSIVVVELVLLFIGVVDVDFFGVLVVVMCFFGMLDCFSCGLCVYGFF